MQLLLTSSKDAYITNKIINNTFRASNANAGFASSLDLFKLFEESGLVVEGSFVTQNITEKSVLLIKFDYANIAALTSSNLNLNSNKFKAFLELKDVSSGLQKPSKFRVKCNPLKKDFQEGFGIDVNNFSDFGSTNYLTASFFGASPVVWQSPGASSGGGTGAAKATGKITVTGAGGFLNTTTFVLNDGTNSVTFTSNNASENASKVDATNYTFGSQNNGGSTATMALRIFTAIALSKANSDLKITASDPSAPEVAVSFVDLVQDDFGLTKNTAIVAANNAGAFNVESFSGGYDETHLDFITSGSYNGTKVDFGSSFYFDEPNDDLVLDVTTAVSASIVGMISNHGFRIGFSGSFDTDQKTRFVKRFGSRHIKNKLISPRLRICFDDSYKDSKNDFYLDQTNDLFLKSKRGSNPANLFNAAGSQITGASCGTILVSSGSFSQSVSFDQVHLSSNATRKPGFYKASISIPSSNADIRKALAANPEGFDLDVEWRSNDATPLTLRKDKINVKGIEFNVDNEVDIAVAFDNRKAEYRKEEDISLQISMKMNRVDYAASKVRKQPENFFETSYFEVREMISDSLIIEKDLLYDSTKLSFYNGTYYAKIPGSSLLPGFTYVLSLCSLIDGRVYNHKEKFKFKVIDK